MKKTVLSTMAISSIFVLLSGCSSHNVAIAPTQPDNYCKIHKHSSTYFTFRPPFSEALVK